MNKPTQEQVKTEIETLEDMKPKVKRFTAFGDDNHAAIDAQIDVLKNGLNAGDITGQYEGEIFLHANEACTWLKGEYNCDTLSEEWEGFVQE